jgi:hypothetical protein
MVAIAANLTPACFTRQAPARVFALGLGGRTVEAAVTSDGGTMPDLDTTRREATCPPTPAPLPPPAQRTPEADRHAARATFFPGLTRLDLWREDSDG